MPSSLRRWDGPDDETDRTQVAKVAKNKMSKYTIGFQHTSNKTADSREEALRIVRIEARQQVRFGAMPRLRHVEGCDGTYIYLSAADAKRDADGSRAFAVVSLA